MTINASGCINNQRGLLKDKPQNTITNITFFKVDFF